MRLHLGLRIGIVANPDERDEFALVYQPKVALCSGDIVGVEALLRWNGSTYGRVSPAEFAPIA